MKLASCCHWQSLFFFSIFIYKKNNFLSFIYLYYIFFILIDTCRYLIGADFVSKEICQFLTKFDSIESFVN
jgi:hypothetical protein